MPQPYPNGELVVVIDCSDLDCSARTLRRVPPLLATPPGRRRFNARRTTAP